MYESDKLTGISPSGVKKKKKEKNRKRKDFTPGRSSSSSTSKNPSVSNYLLIYFPPSLNPLSLNQVHPYPSHLISTPSPPHKTKYKTSPTPPHQPNPPPSSTSQHPHSTDSSAPRPLPSPTCTAQLPMFSQFHTRQESNCQRVSRDKFLLSGI